MLVSRVLLLALVALNAASICTVSADETAGRPAKNIIPELYPEKYPGLRAKPSPIVPVSSLPADFNWCARPDGGCIPNWQQHLPEYFPLCYLHATLTMVGDRIRHALYGKGVPDVILSRQDVLDCAGSFGYGQDETGGGEGVDVLEYMRQHGVPDETCNPFTGNLDGKCDAKARCKNCMMLQNDKLPHCWPVDKYVKYRVKDYGFVSGEAAMMSEIHARGPITCGIAVDDEFCFNYRGGIYQDPNNATDVDHDVEVVGWGAQPRPDGSIHKYWVVRNSWGSYWGHNSFFLIERGINAMRLEEKCLFANPDISELESVLAGTQVGSMFGLIEAGAEPRRLPHGWKSARHDFMTKEELHEAEKEGADNDKWIAKHMRPKAPVSAEVTEAKILAKRATQTAEDRSSVYHSVWFWVAMIAMAVAAGAIFYIVRSNSQSAGYSSIPIHD